MTREQAFKHLGLPLDAAAPTVREAIARLSAEAESRIASAPTDALRAKYEERVQEIRDAEKLLTAETSAPASSPLSSTKMADLPAGRALHTMEGDGEGLDPSVTLEAGRVLGGRYEVRRLIGSGGMGAVYAAFDKNRQEEIAVKVLLPRLVAKEDARQRFLNEAKIGSSLSHPGVVRVHDIQQDADLWFITMELLKGRSLREEMESRKATKKPFTIAEVNSIGRELCEALGYAHTKTVHRDVKPENVWLAENGHVTVMDFGIARLMSTSRMTHTAMSMGTAYYMAPEQLQGAKDVDSRADQYATAVLLYEMLTGRIPTGAFDAPKVRRKDMPAAMNDALMKALKAEPGDRFASMAEFGKALSKGGAGVSKAVLKWVALAAVLLIVAGSAPMWTPTVWPVVKKLIMPVDPQLVAKVQGEQTELETLSTAWEAKKKNLEDATQQEGTALLSKSTETKALIAKEKW